MFKNNLVFLKGPAHNSATNGKQTCESRDTCCFHGSVSVKSD